MRTGLGRAGGEVKKRIKPRKRFRRDVGKGGDLGGKGKKNVVKRGLVQ